MKKKDESVVGAPVVLEGMRFTDVKKNAIIAIEADASVVLIGAPGVGKNALWEEVARDMGYNYACVPLPLLQPSELIGVPMVIDGKGHWVRMEAILPPPNEKWIVNLDELPSAPPSVQVSAHSLLLEKRVGEYQAEADVHFVSNGNRTEDNALIYDMMAPLRNRVTFLDLAPDEHDWHDWAVQSGTVDARVIAFLGWKPSAIYDYRPDKNPRSFASPRSWAKLGRLLQRIDSRKGDVDEYHPLLAGTIGEVASVEFRAFCRVAASLPNVMDILDGGKVEIDPPDKVDALYAFSQVLAEKAASSPQKADIHRRARNLFKYASGRLRGSGDQNVAFATMVIRDFLKSPNVKKYRFDLGEDESFQLISDMLGELAA